MAQKIIKIGSSLGVTIPKRLLLKLDAEQSSLVDVEYNSRKNLLEISLVKNSDPQPSSLFSEVKELVDSHQAEFLKLDD